MIYKCGFKCLKIPRQIFEEDVYCVLTVCSTITCRRCHYIDHGLILDYYDDVMFILLHVLLKLLIITLNQTV